MIQWYRCHLCCARITSRSTRILNVSHFSPVVASKLRLFENMCVSQIDYVISVQFCVTSIVVIVVSHFGDFIDSRSRETPCVIRVNDVRTFSRSTIFWQSYVDVLFLPNSWQRARDVVEE